MKRIYLIIYKFLMPLLMFLIHILINSVLIVHFVILHKLSLCMTKDSGMKILQHVLFLWCCNFLTELSNSPIFPQIFSDDPVRRSHFFIMALSSLRAIDRCEPTKPLYCIVCLFFGIHSTVKNY